MRPRLTRRAVLRLLPLLPGLALPGRAPAAPDTTVRDQGIGGTGARPTDGPADEGDRGIGGTGVIGTIRRFGSIVVNDLRIAYPKDVTVRIDGASATVGDLKIGHVVRVVAREGADGLATRRIDVTSEVVGPVEAVRPGGLTILGQRVAAGAVKGRAWRVGDRVAVSGLRRPDGVVVASLIEPRDAGPSRVTGRVRRGSDGVATIGALRLNGASADLVGRRALLVGEATQGGLSVARSEPAQALFVPGLTRMSIEAYVGRKGAGLNVGSGFDVEGRAALDLPRRGSVRAVLTTDVGRNGALRVERLRIDERVEAPRPQLPGGLEGGRTGMPGRDRLDIDTRTPFGARPGGPGGSPGGGFGGGPGGFGGHPGFGERPNGLGGGGPGGPGPGGPGGGGRGFGGGR